MVLHKIAGGAVTSCVVLVAVAGCSSSPSTRVELVAEACGFPAGEVPEEDGWRVNQDTEPPSLFVEMPDGRTARVEMRDGTTVDALEENLRIARVYCNDDDDVYDDSETVVSWSSGGDAFTVATEEYGDLGTIGDGAGAAHGDADGVRNGIVDPGASQPEVSESPTGTVDTDPATPEAEVTTGDILFSRTTSLGRHGVGLSGAELEAVVRATFDADLGVSYDLETFSCAPITYYEDETASCTVDVVKDPYLTFLSFLPTVEDTSDGRLRVTLREMAD